MIRSMVSTPRTGSDPARRALAARLGEQNSIANRAIRHVDGVVEDDDAAVAEHRPDPASAS